VVGRLRVHDGSSAVTDDSKVQEWMPRADALHLEDYPELWAEADDRPGLSYEARMALAVLAAQFGLGLVVGFLLGAWLA